MASSTDININSAATDSTATFGSLSRSQTSLLAAFLYLTVSTSLTLTNKYIFSDEAFNYPSTTLVIQSLVVVACLTSYQIFQTEETFNPVLLRQLTIPCVLFALFLFTNARALRHLSLPILSVLKSLAPMGIALIERILFREKISRPVALSMVMIIFSNVVALMNRPEASLIGYFWAIFNVIVNIAHVLSLRTCLSAQFSPVEKTIHANMLASVFMIPFAVANREVLPFFIHLMHAPWLFRIVFGLSCILAAAIGASIFWLIQLTSGSTLSFVGACNKFPVVVFGALLFHVRITPVGWMSVFVGVLAGIIFALAKAFEKSDAYISNFLRWHTKHPDVLETSPSSSSSSVSDSRA